MGSVGYSECRWGVIVVMAAFCLSAAGNEYDSPVYALAQHVEAVARDACTPHH